MGLAKGALVSALCATMLASGCSVQSVQREPAKGVDDCRAYWFEERGYGKTRPLDGAPDFATVIESFMSAFARSTTSTAAANQRYRTCLQNFGVTDTDAFESAARYTGENGPYLQKLPPLRPAYCPPNASVLYGGSGYCVGRR